MPANTKIVQPQPIVRRKHFALLIAATTALVGWTAFLTWLAFAA